MPLILGVKTYVTYTVTTPEGVMNLAGVIRDLMKHYFGRDLLAKSTLRRETVVNGIKRKPLDQVVLKVIWCK